VSGVGGLIDGFEAGVGNEAVAERVGAKVEVPLRSRMVRLREGLRWKKRITDLGTG
jgi:hypothetical protein